jgi:hypothetical protein
MICLKKTQFLLRFLLYAIGELKKRMDNHTNTALFHFELFIGKTAKIRRLAQNSLL